MTLLRKLYTDITPEMGVAWDKDIDIAIDSRAVKNSIMGIISTRKGTRPFYPSFGCDLPDQLFENANPLVLATMESNITDAIRNWEPRVTSLKVIVGVDYDRNAIIAEVRYAILDNPDQLEILKLELQK